MNRRSFLKVLAASVGGLVLAAVKVPTPDNTVGRFGVNHPKFYHGCGAGIFLDGVDISKKCYDADDRRGIAWCYKPNKDGKTHLDPQTHEVVREVLHGYVQIVMPDDLRKELRGDV